MLHKYIQKVLKKLPEKQTKRESLFTNNFHNSNKELYFEQEIPLEKMNDNTFSNFPQSERREYNINTLSPSKMNFSRRESNFIQRYSNDNKNFSSDIIESKNKRIMELENKLKEISNLLYDLTVKIKEELKLEDVINIFCY